MGLAGKLKAKTAEAETAVKTNPYTCQTRNCGGVYIPARVVLLRDNGAPLGTVCFRLVCSHCGRAKKMVYEGQTREVRYLRSDEGQYFFNPMNFFVPRELIERPVFDKDGVPVLDAAGKQIMSFDKKLKQEFLEKLFSLLDPKRSGTQSFTLSQVMNAKINNPAN
ncbi:MAG: hypothetical protein ACI37O_04345 [Candidatus Avelusimicrobium sp.]|uniref:hypothetical protein n=1 Tax=Candidatus Avelusimicrobium sp. TaxID=3048833 RepID=UPI003F11C6FE